MARTATPMKQNRTRHSQAFKNEALALAERIGVSKAAEQLGLHASQLYGWRSKQQQTLSSSEREQSLADENARLKRLLAEQAEELAGGAVLPGFWRRYVTTTGIQLHTQQADGVEAEADGAFGEPGAVVEDEALTPLLRLAVVVGGVLGVQVVIEIAQAEAGLAVFDETGGGGLVGDGGQRDGQGQGGFFHA